MSPQALARVGQPTRRRRMLTAAGEVALTGLVALTCFGLAAGIGWAAAHLPRVAETACTWALKVLP